MRSLICLTLVLAACGGDDDAVPAADAAPGDAQPFIPDEGLSGRIDLIEFQPVSQGIGAWGQITVQLMDAPIPRWQNEVAAVGDCTLYTFVPVQCTPDCQGFCSQPNVCTPFPGVKDAGNLSITGTTAPTTITYDSGYYSYDGALGENLFDPGASVTVSAAGGATPAFSLSAQAPPPVMSSIAGDELDLDGTGDVTVSWTPADPGSRMRLTLNANNLGHGSPYRGIIRCDVPDGQGTVTVARSLLEQFPDTNRWEICAGSDCPLSDLTRYHRSATGSIALTLGSRQAFFILHHQP